MFYVTYEISKSDVEKVKMLEKTLNTLEKSMIADILKSIDVENYDEDMLDLIRSSYYKWGFKLFKQTLGVLISDVFDERELQIKEVRYELKSFKNRIGWTSYDDIKKVSRSLDVKNNKIKKPGNTQL